MIVEERDDTLKPGKLAAFVEAYRDHGLQLQLDHLGTFHDYFTSEIGEFNAAEHSDAQASSSELA